MPKQMLKQIMPKPMFQKAISQKLLRWIALALVGGIGMFGQLFAEPGVAQTCTANCGSRQIQFTPGQAVRLQMVNNTASLVQVQQLPLTDTIPLLPGSEVDISSNFGTEPNLSVIFWDETSLAVRAVLFRPEPNLLRIELFPGSGTGDRSVFIENDGRVRLF